MNHHQQLLFDETENIPDIPSRGNEGSFPRGPGPFDEKLEACSGDIPGLRCKNSCWKHIPVSFVSRIRRFLFRAGWKDPGQFADRIHRLHNQYLMLPSGKPCCQRFAARACGISVTRFGGCHRYYRNRDRVKRKTESVVAWFECMRPMLDVIPNPTSTHCADSADSDSDDETGPRSFASVTEYQLPTRNRKHAWQSYQQSVTDSPQSYEPVSFSFFNATWHQYYPNIRCRKYLKFSKCKRCIKYRTIKHDRNATMDQRRDAHNTLQKHYVFVGRERAYSRIKKNESIERPNELLFIAQDGTDQLTYGLPNFGECGKEKVSRIRVGLMVDFVAGDNVYL